MMNQEFTNEPSQSNEFSEQLAESVPLARTALDDASETPQSPMRFDPAFSGAPPSDVASAGPSSNPVSRSISVAVSALSDVGRVRRNNEDCFGYNQSLGIFVVCDGMGGMASGEVASSRAVAAIIKSFADSACSDIAINTRVLHAIKAANLDVWENGQLPENKGMGTTAVVAALDGDKLVLGNVGDSRAYSIQGDTCTQLTIDHSLINELIRKGKLSAADAQNTNIPSIGSLVTRAIGIAPEVQPDFFSVDFKPGTTVLLATDGLTRYFLQDEIAAIIVASPFESSCANLIGLAKERGGQDNITCILVRALPA